MDIEKVQTGAIVIITGEYIAVDQSDHQVDVERYFMSNGERTPTVGSEDNWWKLVEAIDFAS